MKALDPVFGETGEVCNDCGRHYDDVYAVDDELWSRLHERAPAGTLCPSCLVRRALHSERPYDPRPDERPKPMPRPTQSGEGER